MCTSLFFSLFQFASFGENLHFLTLVWLMLYYVFSEEDQLLFFSYFPSFSTILLIHEFPSISHFTVRSRPLHTSAAS